ncbi:LuxR family transcriptional regulator [Verrucosispora sp. FIM060022]|uniref:helix-turn-helix transcriptional regulator n=1 Tax=Verrucosispora sp. FIM060022 TaxID=1479020 RepID=UPI000F87CB5B|nr:LuxR family transcriptional regulator [Verrucosispora sp. FIM060022]RUL90222.1 helix-turn-helix transcriptional regulator [Verrucosispora sp. FIM060022]
MRDTAEHRIGTSGRHTPQAQATPADRLSQALARARSGRGGVVELVGEPGIGKTQALTELTRLARVAGIPIAAGRCTEVTPDSPLTLAAAVTGATGSPGELADALRQAADPAGLLVAVDDFHWASEDSVRLVRALTQTALDVGLLVVIALRPTQTHTGLLAVLADGRDVGVVERVEVGPLTLPESARLLGCSIKDPQVRRLHERAEGNPRYLLALAAPRGAAATALLGEKASLGPDATRVLEAAAVLGGSVDVAGVAEVAGLPRERACAATSVLVRRDLLRPADRPREYVFRHPVLHTLYYDDIDICWRAAAHRRARTLLLSRGAPHSVVAPHVERAPQGSDEDLTVLAGAAQEAMAGTPAQAVHWLGVALDLAPAGAHARNELASALVGALLASGQPTASSVLLHQILRSDPPLSWEARAHALVPGALAECLLGRAREGGSLIAAALAEAPEDPPAVLVRLAVVQGVLASLEGVALTPGVADVALRVARVHGDRLGEMGVLSVRAFGAGGGAASAADLSAAAAIADAAADPDLAADPECLVMLASAESYSGRYRDARRHAARGVTVIRRSGGRHLLPLLYNTLSNSCRRLGELDAAQEAAAAAARIAEQMGAWRLHGLALALRSLSLAWLLPQGDREPVDLAEQAAAILPPGSSTWSATAGLALAQAALAGGDPRRAVTVILDFGGGPGLDDIPDVLRPWSYELLAAASGRADLPLAEWASRAAAVVDRMGVPYLRPYAVSARAHLLRSRNDLAGATALFREAAALFHTAGLAFSQAVALAEAARCQPGAGRADLALAREVARRCGAGRALAEYRIRPSVTEVTHPMLSVLTRREQEIASMAGTGRKTKDISDSLAISPRTVDVHLTRIYRKLNIATRAELARLMASIA